VRLEGDFVWHDTRKTDEAFIVSFDGRTCASISGIAPSCLGPGENCSSFPKGTEHKPFGRETRFKMPC